MQPIKPPVGPSMASAPSFARPTPPYDTGKVKIGLLYVPPPNWSASRDSFALQTALLSDTAVRPTLSDRLSTFFRSFV
jgi:hypothetical protein